MPVLLSGTDAYVQFITVLVIFVVVLGVCAYITKWLADYQKKQGRNKNIDIVETVRIGNNKWIQIIKIGETYKAVALGKDSVTFLGDIPADQLTTTLQGQAQGQDASFKTLLSKAISNKSAKNTAYEDNESDE